MTEKMKRIPLLVVVDTPSLIIPAISMGPCPSKRAAMEGMTASTTIGDILPFKSNMTIAMIIRKPTAATICFSSC